MITCALLFCFLDFGTVRAHQMDVDLNRIHQLPNKLSPIYTSINNNHSRRSIINNEDDVYDYNNNYYNNWQRARPPMHILQTTKSESGQPKEDPKLFYQSESYLREIKGRNTNNEVASIYPGREVVRADEEYARPIRMKKMTKSFSAERDYCVKCPHDRTLIAKPGSDRVLLQRPRLSSCTGRIVPRQIRFVHMYGPNFGSLLHKGSHIVVGKIMMNNKMLQLCKIQVHVILQTCPAPRDLITRCDDTLCNFTCRDPKSELQGSNSLVCGEDLRAGGNLPTCRARSWCMPQLPPEHGRVSCKGSTVNEGAGLVEGSKCKIRCALGWRASRNSVSVCRRGKWTHQLYCQPKRTKS
ncbi:unnamed protein product [Colias eurytheme]|nr:unnamed protein product [Colias eurytheme]